MAKEYDVGYGRPPKNRQFQKGQTGNPRGRRKGSHNLKTDLFDELRGRITVTEGRTRRQLTRQQVLIKRLIAMAFDGNIKAASLLLSLKTQWEREAGKGPDVTPSTKQDVEILQRFMERELRKIGRGSRNE